MNCQNVVESKGLDEAAQMLVDFNREFDEPAPEPHWLAGHLRSLVDAGDTSVLTYGPPTIGVAVLRFRVSTWSADLEAYLAEFYIRPAFRGNGHGTAFLDEVVDHARSRGATYMDLTTTASDEAARHVYEKRGFDCHEGKVGGATSFYYEMELN